MVILFLPHTIQTTNKFVRQKLQDRKMSSIGFAFELNDY